MSDHIPTTSPDSETGTGVRTVRPLEWFSRADQVLALEAVWLGTKEEGSFADLAAKALNKVRQANLDGTLPNLYEGWSRDPDKDN